MPRRDAPRQLERAEQEALVAWFHLQYPDHLIFAIPNGLARPGSAASSVKSGLVPGIPDLFLAVPRGTYGGMFIELKRPKGVGTTPGKPSIKQLDMLQHLNRAGYLGLLCYGWSEAANAIVDYMAN